MCGVFQHDVAFTATVTISDVYRSANVRTEQTPSWKYIPKTDEHRYTRHQNTKAKTAHSDVQQYTNTFAIQSVSNRKFSSVKKLNRLEFYLINHHHV